MSYMPTLGGIKKAQEFFVQSGHPLPIFQMEIYKNAECLGACGWSPKMKEATTVDLDDAIVEFGAAHKVIDVRLRNASGDKYLNFSDPKWRGIASLFIEDETFCCLQSDTRPDAEFRQFLSTLTEESVLRLVSFGKSEITLLDRALLELFPQTYFRLLFT